MKIIIYNPSSLGGNYDYSTRLYKAYKAYSDFEGVMLVLPKSAPLVDDSVNFLMRDTFRSSYRVTSRLHFLIKSIINPLLFYFFLRKNSKKTDAPSWILFNDYEQATVFLWWPFFFALKRRFKFAVMLHDPDRDAYFSSKFLSNVTMRAVMSLMDVAFYHEYLPKRDYYDPKKVQFVSVPHGVYGSEVGSDADKVLQGALTDFKKQSRLLGALGNIRAEKNYPMVISAVQQLPNVRLVIAGSAANSSINVESLTNEVKQRNLQDRVLIINKYLTQEELNAVANACDGFVLYYSATFKSQSGVLNMVAQQRKPLLVSNIDSALSQLTEKFNLGLLIEPDSLSALEQAIIRFGDMTNYDGDWDGYMQYASWQRHVSIAIQTMTRG